ncbi:hypothetical protein HanRHA438_Chr13g0591181 [Helianthus annuus]|nr:hypothetical protein HanIR_Chr13g0631751 [Helianthus annuus]KAJ0857521.1 hypothetical protein HanRHA438_Chr13g0591181 [Helianthus annuus]
MSELDRVVVIVIGWMSMEPMMWWLEPIWNWNVSLLCLVRLPVRPFCCRTCEGFRNRKL